VSRVIEEGIVAVDLRRKNPHLWETFSINCLRQQKAIIHTTRIHCTGILCFSKTSFVLL
jgi:hypothetical protein